MKALENGSSASVKFSKTQLSKTVELEEFLGRLLEPLLQTGLPIIGNLLKPLVKRLLIGLGLTAVVSSSDAAIQKKFLDQVLLH